MPALEYPGDCRSANAPVLQSFKSKSPKSLSLFFLFVFLLGAPQALAFGRKAPSEALCPSFGIRGKLSPELNATEKRLICGDPETDAWKTIPDSQARMNLKNFLQDRGYFEPGFTREGETTWASVGQPTIVSGLKMEGAPPELHVERRRKVIGEVLTPTFLSGLEGWASSRLQASGYPCPEVTSVADPKTGEVRLKITTGPRQDLNSITEEMIPGLEPGMMRRHDAFRFGKPYNDDWMVVSAKRIMDKNILESVHFTVKCGPEGATAQQDSVPGLPRLVSFGVGINTEGLFLLKGSWQNARLGHSGSTMGLSALGSIRQQQLDASADWYFLDEPSRQSIRPLIRVRHDNQASYETLSSRWQVAHATSWDSQELGANLLMGPTLDLFRVFRGVGAPNSHFLSMEFRLGVMSHDFEFYRSNPITGFNTSISLNLNHRDLFSSASAQRLVWMGEMLWNYRNYDPALWVVGIRSGAATTITSEPMVGDGSLPPNFLQYLGGSQNIRGYGLLELPANGIGGLSSIFVDLEARLSHTLPFNLEPLFFIDFAALGSQPMQLNLPFYYSPGFGLRLGTPFGVFRSTLAHGFSSNGPDHFQFYFSFGEEF